jgi:hypothetical protein
VNADDAPEVVVCAGPPDCELRGDEAIANAKAGCPRCDRYRIEPGATEDPHPYRKKAH